MPSPPLSARRSPRYAKAIRLPYPVGGVNEGTPFSALPKNQTRVALNCRSFDQLQDRMRGGPRGGTFKWHQGQVDNQTAVVQDINALVQFAGAVDDLTPDDGYPPLIQPPVNPNTGTTGQHPGTPRNPGIDGNGPWYVNPRKCSDPATRLDRWIEWGLLPFFLNAFRVNGVCWYANPFDNLIDNPPDTITHTDAAIQSLRHDSCDECENVNPCGAGVDLPVSVGITFAALNATKCGCAAVGGNSQEVTAMALDGDYNVPFLTNSPRDFENSELTIAGAYTVKTYTGAACGVLDSTCTKTRMEVYVLLDCTTLNGAGKPRIEQIYFRRDEPEDSGFCGAVAMHQYAFYYVRTAHGGTYYFGDTVPNMNGAAGCGTVAANSPGSGMLCSGGTAVLS